MPFKDPEKDRAYHKKYSKDHAKEKALKTREWVKNNPGKKKAWDLKQLGWTLEGYYLVSAAQDNRCAVCRQPQEGKALAADHEHSDPPKPRGLLCSECNTGLGKFKDSPMLLDAAAAYLRKYGAK